MPANVKLEFMLKNSIPNVTLLLYLLQVGEKLFLNRLVMILSFAPNVDLQ